VGEEGSAATETLCGEPAAGSGATATVFSPPESILSVPESIVAVRKTVYSVRA